MIDRTELHRALGFDGHPGYDARSLHGILKELDIVRDLVQTRMLDRLIEETDKAKATETTETKDPDA